jgi:hypothetical protein
MGRYFVFFAVLFFAVSVAVAAHNGVPHLVPNYDVSVEEWWGQHPYNPEGPNYDPVINSPSPVIDITDFGGDIQAAIDSLSSTGGAVIYGGGIIIPCELAEDYASYDLKLISGDVTIVARISSVENTNDYAKAGVMIRETLDSNSTHMFMAMSAVGNYQCLYRLTTGGSTMAPGDYSSLPRWIKLVHSGNTITGYQSTNGTS